MSKELFLESRGFSGVNLRSSESRLKGPLIGQERPAILELREAKNFDITDLLTLRQRPGKEKKLELVAAHSGVSFGGKIILQANGSLLRVTPKNWTSETLVSGLNPNALVSFAEVQGSLYWMNGEVMGKITESGNNNWGLERPWRVQAAANGNGDFDAGEYQVALTFLKNGEESGATISSKISVPQGGGISLSFLPQGGDTIRVYLSRTNGGEGMFRHSDWPLGTTSLELRKVQPMGKRLTTQFANKPPVGHIVRYFDGRLLIARGNTIFFTMPQQYGLCRLRRDFLPPFSARIRMIRPVDGGFFVDAGELFFVKKGEVPELMFPLGRENSCVEGSDIEVPGFWFGENIPGNVGFWWTQQGWPVIGLGDGSVLPIGKERMAAPRFDAGASLAREREGLRNLLTAMKGPGSSFACTDTLEATVRIRQ